MTAPMPTSRNRQCWVSFCRLGKWRPRQLPLHWFPNPNLKYSIHMGCITTIIERDTRKINLYIIIQGLTQVVTVHHAIAWPANQLTQRENMYSLSTQGQISHITQGEDERKFIALYTKQKEQAFGNPLWLDLVGPYYFLDLSWFGVENWCKHNYM